MRKTINKVADFIDKQSVALILVFDTQIFYEPGK